MTFDEENKWLELANKYKDKYIQPVWSWDCNHKLDFDGPLLRVSSRFYQERDKIYSGSVDFVMGEKPIFSREFSSRHIENLQNVVEEYCAMVQIQLTDLLVNIIKADPFNYNSHGDL